jgi:hypothetical protein
MEFIIMSLNSTVTVSIDELLEELEDRLNIITSLIYQNKLEEILLEISYILKQEKVIRQTVPHINGVDWFESIIKAVTFYQSNPSEKQQLKHALQDALFENTPHLARFRRDEKNKHKNNRIIFEEIFSTAVKTFGLEHKVGCLVRLMNTLCETNSGRNENVTNTLAQIKNVSKDFECHSFLSISLSWEVVTSSINTLCEYARNSQDIFELKFPKLEQTILDIDYCLDEIYGFINHELQTSYFLAKTTFEYQRLYSEKSIF